MLFTDIYDRWLNSYPPDEDTVLFNCKSCEADIFKGQEAVRRESHWYCDTRCLLDDIGYSVEIAEPEFTQQDYEEYVAENREDF